MTNKSRSPATDVVLRVLMTNGDVIEARAARLEPVTAALAAPVLGHARALVGDARAQFVVRLGPAASSGGPPVERSGRDAVLRYSDERGIARYEQRFGFVGSRQPDGSEIPTYDVLTEGEVRRIR